MAAMSGTLRQVTPKLLRPLFTNCSQKGPQTLPRVMASARSIFSSHVVRNKDAKEGIENNPYYSKYEDKIKKVLKEQEEQGLRMSEEERKRRLGLDPRTERETQWIKENMRKHEEKMKKLGISEKSSSGDMPLYTEKSLEKIMHMDLLADKTGEEIGKLWSEYHSQRNCISAVIPAAVYEQIERVAEECPIFIHPLPRDQGYEFMYSEFNKDKCYITSLINYQAFGSEAPWCLALKHYTELKESKGIVLMVGEIDSDKLDTTEAMCIANHIQLYYTGNNQTKLDLLQTFNHQPDTFRHTDIVQEFERSLFELSK